MVFYGIIRHMIREFIRLEIKKAVKKLYGREIAFDVSADSRHGDYASNVAMAVGGNPKANAQEIKGELEKSEKISKIVSKIEIAGPGFLNFFLSEDGLLEGLKFLGERSARRKFVKSGFRREKIQVEFISANPTGQLHIGHGRSAFYGDALANVLERAGYKVEREYFINDSKESTQIRELGKTVLGKGKSYLTDYLKLKITKLKIKNLSESDAGYLMAKEIQKDNQEFITKKLGIKFDNWFSEEEKLRKKGKFEAALKLLRKKNLVYEKDGALWLKTSQFGDDEDRVLVRSDGSVSYFLSDIAYHIDKVKRGFDKIINIWGADHQGHVKRMMAVKKMLGWKADIKILISQMVTIKEAGEAKKLSKRKGTLILLEELIDEIGLDAARWFYLQKSLSSHMEFDMALAKERSQKNPVYYVQYSYARMCSILKKAGLQNSIKKIAYPYPSLFKKQGGARAHTYNFFYGILLDNYIRPLILKLIQFPEIIEDISQDYQVHRITTYAYELASEFSQFYRDVKVIGSENEKELLALVALTRRVLSDALSLLGISAPEKM